MKSRWKLLSIVALLGVALLALAPWKAQAAGAPEHVIVVSDNKVLHPPEELAEMLRAHGADEAGVQRVLTFERRLNDAERRGLPQEEIRRLAEQWAQELFPPPPPNFTDVPEDMLGGKVVEVNGRRMDVQTAQGVRTVVLAPNVTVDEGAWTAAFPVAPGDQVFMVGHPTSQNWVADKIWINAVNITGVVRKCHLKGQEVVCEIKTTRLVQNKNTVEGWLPRRFLIGEKFDPVSGLPLKLWQGKISKLKEGDYVRVVGRMYKGRLCIINIFDEKER